MDDLAKVPLSFPTYAGILGSAAYRAAQQIHPEVDSRFAEASHTVSGEGVGNLKEISKYV